MQTREKSRVVSFFGGGTSLRQNFLGDGAVDIGQSKVAAAVTVGQLFVIEAHEVQHRGVKVVNVHTLFNGSKTEFVG